MLVYLTASSCSNDHYMTHRKILSVNTRCILWVWKWLNVCDTVIFFSSVWRSFVQVHKSSIFQYHWYRWQKSKLSVYSTPFSLTCMRLLGWWINNNLLDLSGMQVDGIAAGSSASVCFHTAVSDLNHARNSNIHWSIDNGCVNIVAFEQKLRVWTNTSMEQMALSLDYLNWWCSGRNDKGDRWQGCSCLPSWKRCVDGKKLCRFLGFSSEVLWSRFGRVWTCFVSSSMTNEYIWTLPWHLGRDQHVWTYIPKEKQGREIWDYRCRQFETIPLSSAEINYAVYGYRRRI